MDQILTFRSLLPGHPPPRAHAQPAARRLPGPVFFLVAPSTLVADLSTKAWAEHALRTRAGSMPVLDGILRFGFRPNPLIAWSLLGGVPAPVRAPLFVGMGVLALVWMQMRAMDSAALRSGIPLVMGGALGNLVDRVRHGYVVDFIDVHATWGGALHQWPVFNVADIAICLGVGLWLTEWMRRR